MSRDLSCAALAALLSSFPLASPAAEPVAAPAAEPGPTPAKDRRFELDLSAAVLGGGLDGYGVRQQSGGQMLVEVSAQPTVRGDRWYLDVPLRVAHRQTFGTELSETKGKLDVEPWYVVSKNLRIGLDAGASGANRPDWPDLYQPTNASGGGLLPTDRYSYLSWHGGAKLYARPARHQHLRASYSYVDYDYTDDPEFDPDPTLPPVEGIMHLTPRDRTEHHVDTSWRYRQDTWTFGLQLDYMFRRYDTLLARDRNDGRVTVGVNPEQELGMWNPAVELGLVRMNGKLEITLGYGIELWNDPYQGYYSATAHVPKAKAQLALSDRLRAEVRIAGWYATYAADASNRLEGNDTDRKDSKTRVTGELEYTLRGGLALQARLGYVTRSTNYEDYVPVPAGGASRYDIDFDYTNFTALAGVRYEL